MNITESPSFKIVGKLHIYDMTNKRIVLEKNNLTVNTAKTIMASALTGHPSCDYISFISFGSDVSLVTPTPPTIVDRALVNQIYQSNCSYDSPPTPYFENQIESDGTSTTAATVVFSSVIPAGVAFEAVEAGLFSAKQYMFSRIIFSSIVKETSASWLVKWSLAMKIV